MKILSGYKTYIVSALLLIDVLVNGLVSGKWNVELTAIATLGSTIRMAIENIQ